MDYVYSYFLVRELFKRLLNSLNRALNVCLYDNLKLLNLAELHLVKEVVKRNLGLRIEDFLFLCRLSLVNKCSCKAFVTYCVKDVTANRHFVKSRNLNRNGRTCLLYSFALVVCHNSYSAHAGACDNCVALVERTVLNKHCCNRSSALVKTSLDYSALCGSVGVSLKLLHLGNEKHHFEQVVKTFLCLCRNGNTRCVAAPFFGNKLMFCELLFYCLGICTGFIHLVDCYDYGNSSRLCVVDSLNSLGHNSVVSRNNEDCNIRYLRTSCSHCCERLVSGGVEECNRLVVDFNSISTYVLCDTACFACGYICVTNSVED